MINPELEEKIKKLIDSEIKNGTFPGAVVLVEKDNSITCGIAGGHRDPNLPGDEMTRDTLFDLASLTKPLATALLTLIVFEEEKESVYSTLSRFFDNLPEESRGITVFQLLTHSSGLPPVPDIYLSFPDSEKINPRLARKILLSKIPVKKPGREIIYSCTGYLFTGLILERITGIKLSSLFKKLIVDKAGITDLFFNPEKIFLNRIAPTEYCKWRNRRLRGEVHDENSYCMGGDGGNAGLFGTADSALKLTKIFTDKGLFNGRRILKEESVNLMTHAQIENRSVGFMVQNPLSPCGLLFSKDSYGHTGFTGTSIWIEPEESLKIIVFTNRVYFGRENTAEKIKSFRREVHSLIRMELAK